MIDLPAPVSAYFRADAEGGEAVARCFTESGTVRDEAHVHAGRDAIRRWKDSASAKYDYVSKPVAISFDDGKAIVTGHVTGDFPGSPVDLRYVFTLEGDRIAALEIGV